MWLLIMLMVSLEAFFRVTKHVPTQDTICAHELH